MQYLPSVPKCAVFKDLGGGTVEVTGGSLDPHPQLCKPRTSHGPGNRAPSKGLKLDPPHHSPAPDLSGAAQSSLVNDQT